MGVSFSLWAKHMVALKFSSKVDVENGANACEKWNIHVGVEGNADMDKMPLPLLHLGPFLLFSSCALYVARESLLG